MRTDVKVGLICLFAIVLGVVIYFVAQGNAHPRDAKADGSAVTGSGTPATPKAGELGTILVAPATPPAVTPAAPTMAADSAGAAVRSGTGAPVQLAQASPTPPGGPVSGGMIVSPASPNDRVLLPAAGAAPTGLAVSPAAPALTGGTPGGMTPSTMPSASPPTTAPALGGTVSLPTGRPSVDSMVPTGRPEVSTAGSGAESWSGRPTVSLGSPGMTGGVSPRGINGAGSGNNGLGGSGGIGSLGTSGGATPRIPAGASAANTHKIEKGDMLGAIARKYGTTVAAIEKANPGVDSSHLKIGATINIPAATVAAASPTMPVVAATASPRTPVTTRPAASAGAATAGTTAVGKVKPGSTYTVKKGDTLASIAQSAYGDKKAWSRIFRANRGEISNANSVSVGTVLTIPS